MAQYVYTMRRVSKSVPPKRTILKNISLNFFPGAKIGVLGLNGSGKSSLLKIMAGGGEEAPRRDLRRVFRARRRLRQARRGAGEARGDRERRRRRRDGGRRRRAAPAALGAEGGRAFGRREAARSTLPFIAFEA